MLAMLTSVETTSFAASSNDEVEFRSYPDDAWYNVRLLRQGEKLRVKYCHFADQHDDVFEAGKFESFEELEEFKCRFRPVSVQLQDGDCAKVVEGLHVCASHSFNDSDVRFYDAVVDYVCKKRHYFSNGEEECLCSFIVTWQQGPSAGMLMEKKVENICLIQSNAQLNPTVASFLEIVRKRIDKKCKKRPVSQFLAYEGYGNLSDGNKQDIDFGGARSQNMILLENLEKELSPSTVVEFIHRHTSIASHACVFPSLSSEMYSRGAIFLDLERDLKDLNDFLNNPNHFIVSARGRPWVVAKNFSRDNIIEVPMVTVMLKSQNNSSGIGDELQLVPSGTEEYKKAKELRDLFMEFALHQERLHKRLAMEEKKILQPSPAL